MFSVLSGQINTGFLAFADRVLVSAEPRRTRAAAGAMVQQCWEARPAPNVRTRMVPVIIRLTETLKRMSVVFVVSDFFTDDNVLGSKELAILAARSNRPLTAPAGVVVVCGADATRMNSGK